jgi:hypothetical protein
MDRNTYRDDDGDEGEEPQTYWRRRALTLTAGLGVLGLLAWALSGGGGGKPSPQATSSGSMSAAAYPNTPASSPSAAASGAGANASVPGLTGASSSAASRLPAASSPAAQNSAAPSAAAIAAGAGPDGSCAPSSVVLSLFASKGSYGKGQNAVFTVDAVSTAAGTCTLDTSPAQLHLVVMASGRIIWDSADCAKSGQTSQAKLSRGVPVQQGFTWNRSVTLPGCSTLATSAKAGTYTAQAKAGSVTSPVRTFKLTD